MLSYLNVSLKKCLLATGIFAAGCLIFASCSKDTVKEEVPEESTSSYSYIVFTNEGDLNTPGYMTAYDQMPSGDFSNIGAKSLQMSYAFGFTQYGKWIFNRSSISGQSGIQKLTVSDDGSIKDGGFLANGAMFLIVNETLGYYSDESRGTMKCKYLIRLP
jgi:hypothetical protein